MASHVNVLQFGWKVDIFIVFNQIGNRDAFVFESGNDEIAEPGEMVGEMM